MYQRNLTLLTDLYELTMMQGGISRKKTPMKLSFLTLFTEATRMAMHFPSAPGWSR